MRSYQDIIHFRRPKSKYPAMSALDRAAQFAPFSALVGYREALLESERQIEQKRELSLEQTYLLNEKLLYLKDHLKEQPFVKVTYFIADETKLGGCYQTIEARLQKLDEVHQTILLSNQLQISMREIIEIDF